MTKLADMTEPELRELMNSMARGIEGTALISNVEKPRFVLILFNDPAVGQYVCNCNRSDMIKTMRETADRLERREYVAR